MQISYTEFHRYRKIYVGSADRQTHLRPQVKYGFHCAPIFKKIAITDYTFVGIPETNLIKIRKKCVK
jgi:hypothetical protein